MTTFTPSCTTTCTIPIDSRGQHAVAVDQQDYADLTQWRWIFKTSRWRYGAKVYARRDIWVRDDATQKSGRKVTLYMHRVILTERMGLPPPSDKHEGDHVDIDSLNNIQANLKWSTKSEQNANQKPRITKRKRSPTRSPRPRSPAMPRCHREDSARPADRGGRDRAGGWLGHSRWPPGGPRGAQ